MKEDLLIKLSELCAEFNDKIGCENCPLYEDCYDCCDGYFEELLDKPEEYGKG